MQKRMHQAASKPDDWVPLLRCYGELCGMWMDPHWNSDSVTPLHVAAAKGNPETVHLMLQVVAGSQAIGHLLVCTG